jgi:hypothetical protein
MKATFAVQLVSHGSPLDATRDDFCLPMSSDEFAFDFSRFQRKKASKTRSERDKDERKGPRAAILARNFWSFSKLNPLIFSFFEA